MHAGLAWSAPNGAGWRATEISVDWGGVASRAIDGDVSTSWAGNSCTHTAAGPKPWLGIDFGVSISISNVTLWNRADSCCRARLRSVEVRVGSTEPTSTTSVSANALCKAMAGPLPAGSTTLQCGTVLQGQYLTVQLVNVTTSAVDDVLSLCEVVPNWPGK